MYEHERQVQIHKNEGFTVLSNGFIRDKNLSNRALKELIDLNYIRRDKIRLSNGRFKHIYHIYDEPVANGLKMEFLPEVLFQGWLNHRW